MVLAVRLRDLGDLGAARDEADRARQGDRFAARSHQACAGSALERARPTVKLGSTTGVRRRTEAACRDERSCRSLLAIDERRRAHAARPLDRGARPPTQQSSHRAFRAGRAALGKGRVMNPPVRMAAFASAANIEAAQRHVRVGPRAAATWKGSERKSGRMIKGVFISEHFHSPPRVPTTGNLALVSGAVASALVRLVF